MSDDDLRKAPLRAFTNLIVLQNGALPTLTVALVLNDGSIISAAGSPYLVGHVSGHPLPEDDERIAASSPVAISAHGS